VDTPFPNTPPEQDNNSEGQTHEQDSLIQRALRAGQSQAPDDDPIEPMSPIAPSTRVSPVPGYNTSPVRPEDPERQRQQVKPTLPRRPSRPVAPVRADPTPTEEIDRGASVEEQATQALERLRQKMAAVAEEFAQGKINRAQFHAIYQRYQEQRQITEMLLQRDPQTGAWQTVMRPGHTGFLRDYYEAKIESYAIYHLALQKQVIVTGGVQLPIQQVAPLLGKLKAIINDRGYASLARRKLSDERWVVFVPGAYTVSVVVFSLEPSPSQLQRIEDMQHDFERANAQALGENRIRPRELVYPHRALFENKNR
jgi:hypothetical protein